MQRLIVTIALLASTAIAVPSNDGYSIHSAEDGPTGPLLPIVFTGPWKWADPRSNSTTAQEIYEQILKLNPSYDPWDFPDFQASQAAKGVSKTQCEEENTNITLATRSSSTNSLDARQSYDCGWGGWVRTWGNCIEGITYLRRLGNAWCRARAQACSRVSCSTGSGIFLCSQQNNEMAVYCQDIATDVGKIYTKCGEEIYGGALHRLRGKMNFGSGSLRLLNLR